VGDVHRRDQAEEQAGQERQASREAESPAIQADLLDPGEPGRSESHEDVRPQAGDQDAQCGAGDGHDQTLDQEPTGHACPIASERQTYGDLVLAAGRPDQQKIGEIHTRDQKHEPDRG
jgi:hypothetical protein